MESKPEPIAEILSGQADEAANRNFREKLNNKTGNERKLPESDWQRVMRHVRLLFGSIER